MIYRGPDFLTVVWFGSSPTLSPPPSLDWRHTGRLRKRDNLLTGAGGGEEWACSRIILPQESLVLYISSNTLWIRLVNTATIKICPYPWNDAVGRQNREICLQVLPYPLTYILSSFLLFSQLLARRQCLLVTNLGSLPPSSASSWSSTASSEPREDIIFLAYGYSWALQIDKEKNLKRTEWRDFSRIF